MHRYQQTGITRGLGKHIFLSQDEMPPSVLNGAIFDGVPRDFQRSQSDLRRRNLLSTDHLPGLPVLTYLGCRDLPVRLVTIELFCLPGLFLAFRFMVCKISCFLPDRLEDLDLVRSVLRTYMLRV